MKNLLEKYDVPAPRYTSYPTVPYWQEAPPSAEVWKQKVRQAFEESPAISLYIHLPFCERLCTYCGCNKRITRNHGVEVPYIESILQEWKMYIEVLGSRPRLAELHLGGGTPTFFSPDNLARLLDGIMQHADVAPAWEFGFEAHPASTTKEHLEVLHRYGFRRLSIGVQDFDPEILRIINRLQTLEDVERVTHTARELGYQSINYDFIFGLPLQRLHHIERNMELVRQSRPERLAFYSYAHVPWIKPSQRAYSESDLPVGAAKRRLYEHGRNLLIEAGYAEIGMDHFALPGDSLYQAAKDGSLHRNFMGYTPRYTRLSLALGASSISDSWDAFVQNEKHVETYRQRVAAGELPIARGHLLSPEDLVLRRHILDIMCRYQTHWDSPDRQCAALADGLLRMEELLHDGLVVLENNGLRVTPIGKAFLRNICMALDARYWARTPQGALFSQAV